MSESYYVTGKLIPVSSVSDAAIGRGSLVVHFKPFKMLPLYCKPVPLFLFVWILMLVALSFHISYVSYPTMGVPLLLFSVSLASMLLGYAVSTAALSRGPERGSQTSFAIDVRKMRQLNNAFAATCLSIIAFNWVTQGPPPLFGHIGDYLIYGRLKQILFALLVVVTVNATFDSSKLRKCAYVIFGLAWLLIYMSRGFAVQAAMQILFAHSLKTSVRLKWIYLAALAGVVSVVIGATALGNQRTAKEVFLVFMQIRPKYNDWPSAFLWLDSYIAVPFSNLCWLVDKIPFHGPTLSFLYSLLPSFWNPADPHASIHDDVRIIDGVSTYLMNYVLDLSYFGVFFANFLLGVGCGWARVRGGGRQMLATAVFMVSLLFIFFVDYFSILSTVIIFWTQKYVQKRCFYPLHAEVKE